MTIRQRLFWTLLILTGLLGLIGFFGLRAAWDVRQDFERVSDETLPVVQALEEIRFGVLRALSSSVEYALVKAGEEVEEEEEQEEQEVVEAKALYQASLARYLDLVARFFPAETALAEELQRSTDALIDNIDVFVALAKRGTSGPELLAEKMRLEALERDFLEKFQRVLDHERDELEERRQAVSATIAAGQKRVTFLALLGLVVASALGVNLFLLFSRALQKLNAGAEKFGRGDLAWKIDVEGEHELAALGGVLETMAGDLQQSTVSTTFLHGLLHSMLDGLIVISPDCTIRMVNRALTELLGQEEEALLGTPVKRLFADPRFTSMSRLDAFLQAGFIGQQTSSLVAKDGDEIPVSLSSALLLNGDTIDGIVCLAQDLRGSLRLQEEALRQRDLLEGTLASIGDAVIATDTAAKVTFLNPVAEAMTGWSRVEAEGRDIAEVFQIASEQTGAVARNPVHQVLAEGVTVGMANHTVLTARDGRRLPIDDSGAPIRDKNGKLRGVILVFRDVTERRRINRDLLAAKLAADRANQTKSEFLAMMSHEIRTPLNGIVGVCRLLLDSNSLGAQEKEYAETIRLSGDTLMTLIEDILDFSKIETGAIEVERNTFDLLQSVEDALEIVMPRSLEKDLELHYQLDPELPAVIVGDANRLRQVLVNLVGNAIKFTPQGEISVWVTIHRGEGPQTVEAGSQERLLFAIKDTGIGIAPDEAERIFEPFAQIDPSRTRKYGGSGLGLTISRRLVEMMGGSLWVEAGASGGSTFFFTVAMPTPMRLLGQRRSKQQVLEGKHALIISDSATQLSVLSSLCLSWDMLPSTISAGREARELLERQPADVAIIDLARVGMPGRSLCSEIHALTPIIALASSKAEAENGLEDLASAVIFKPIKHSSLLRTLTQVVEPKAGTDNSIEPRFLQADHYLATRLPLRILIAEDDFINRKVAGAILESMGYEADFVNDGSKALAAIQKQRYDVVFMDLRMPEMDGLEATRKIIEALGQAERPKIIAMTASALEEDRQLCHEAGMDDFISKPVLPHVIRETILRWCSNGDHADELDSVDRATSSRAATLDHEHLALLRDMDALHAVTTPFLEKEPARLKSIHEALDRKDYQQLADRIHPVVGTAGAIGAFKLSELCQRLEKLARNDEDAGACAEALEEVEYEFRLVRDALEVARAETPDRRS